MRDNYMMENTVLFAFVIAGVLTIVLSFFFFRKSKMKVQLLRVILVQWTATFFVSLYDFAGLMDKFPELEFSIQLLMVILPILTLAYLYPKAVKNG